jgi:hypothetical protein
MAFFFAYLPWEFLTLPIYIYYYYYYTKEEIRFCLKYVR